MRKAGGGCFVNDRLDRRRAPASGPHLVQRLKGAAIVTSRSMAAELGPDRIRVNVINP